MKSTINALVLFALLTTCGFGQDDNSKTGFDWLRRFEGDWNVTSLAPNQEKPVGTGTFSGQTLGNQWMVGKYDAKMGSMDFKAVQRLGYDPKSKRYVGSWFDSTASHVWQYDGSLNEKGTTLTLNSQGPGWQNPDEMKDYRDLYEFVSPTKIATTSQMKNDDGQWQTFMTGTMTKAESSASATTVKPFLMFVGRGIEAIEYYKAVFPGTKIVRMEKYGSEGPGKEGEIKVAEISIAGQSVMVTDSPIKHDFDFTPSFSFFVECENESQLKERFQKLSSGGKVMMPLNNYGFSKQFGWTSDKFGVSWQLNLN